jgi:hypothetical protein
MFYLLFLVGSFMLTYFGLFLLFPAFFEGRLARPTARSAFSLGLILVTLLAILVLVVSVPDQTIGNRLLHALGGGFLSFLICYRVAVDTRVAMSSFQFLVFGALVVTALGVGNEILELFFAVYLRADFQSDGYDTWLDLVSNTVGAGIGAAVFVPLLRLRRFLTRPIAGAAGG